MNAPPPAHTLAAHPAVRPQPRPGRARKVVLGAAFLLLGLAVAADAFFLEPNWIEVTRHHVRAASASDPPHAADPPARPLKIAHLSDLHTNGIGPRERQLLALLEAERPDLIVITGDTLARRGKYEACRELLSHLRAPLGVWVVRGNWENWRPLRNERAFYASAGVNFLLNEARPAGDSIWLAGLDDASTGSPDLEATLKGVPADAFTIVLFHSPAFFDQVAGRCPLALAGHTHGGQVRLPLVPVFWLPRGSGKYVAGWYQHGGAQMYVSRGIGTSILPVRFRCRPELVIITVDH